LWKEKKIFMEGFRGSSVMKEKVVAVIVEYVPNLHSPNALAENRKIEWDLGLAMEELVLTRWIKPVQSNFQSSELCTQSHSSEPWRQKIR